MANDFNQKIIEEFRANDGRVGGPFEGARLLLLTTTGARSGARHTTPLGYLPDSDGRVLVIASAAGAPRHPAWYHNLVANPRVHIETGVFVYDADAVVLTGEERDQAFARAVETDDGWAEYQSRTTRTIPVVSLRPVAHDGPPTLSGPQSFGDALTRIHDVLRRELALIRQEVAASGTSLGAQLRINCLSLCQGLHNHHEGESQGMFPMIARQFPETADVMARLADEHRKVAELIDELQRVVTADRPDPKAALAEVDRLSAELEAHLLYEEEQLIPLFDR
ncbi:nitroreductase/quinone reductase family protein [Streptomyces qinzhouensis]|uniref:Nitroreductase family deazaflavin-dependent oxidoreductase n=1 Tax=Streptomyces qinzhouensis TaxID=2599401 RepID=A0A5B8IC02_9ACTN|nr:nitroreductase/quinone reductase family protein [Streptomyces qinzhouensis]QDY75272.1 nitroreductase family deazaflavin-dependent oxidoreductase [Streptomyces qinzhouensis]